MGPEINIIGGTMEQSEINAYLAHGAKSYPGRNIARMDITLDGEYVDLQYHLSDQPFERIRRITGYLVGTMNKWNNAKRAEESDRVKHSCCG
ncbi:MAG: hypothetical protein LBN26_01015 [Christensenellaceae bacterium]|jgi:hypothetical protein|nr:hypothetical protein [Christensenellaceae bacterium]